jgi:tetratricopeptide (TPR) repeat protein
MSRFYLIFFLFLLSFASFGQNFVKKYIKFADEQYKKGDYYYALEYYKLALESDSSNIDLLWKYAETHRAYKDYRKAEYYYGKVYQREKAKKYPFSLLYFGLMQKQNHNYSKARETFKLAKKTYQKATEGYLYLKAVQEINSCEWALNNCKDSLPIDLIILPEEVNTSNAEFPHAVKDGKLIFSSLRADSMNIQEEILSPIYKTKLYYSSINEGVFQPNKLLDSLIIENKSRGNGTFSIDGKTYYFSVCEDLDFSYKCQIWYSSYSNGSWSLGKPLDATINEIGANTTMPAIGMLNGKESLFFSSDRANSKGGLDLYFAELIASNTGFSTPLPITVLNSLDNDITPWWDNTTNRLYFSSSWEFGFGGHDVFYSEFSQGQFQKPINAGLPINGPANDIYYLAQSDTIYFASNRIGTNSVKNPTCCSDIFSAFSQPLPAIIDTTVITSKPRLRERFPVQLYFHNDEPTIASWDTVTPLNYLQAYSDYKKSVPKYIKVNTDLMPIQTDRADRIQGFFSEKVDKGIQDLDSFTRVVLEEVKQGGKVKIGLKGFASPLAPTDYNVNLTKRRINSIINYLIDYQNGVFIPYLSKNSTNGPQIILEFAPFGEYKADQTTSDNPKDPPKSIFSYEAAIERRIEIEASSFISFENQFPIVAPKSTFDAGQIKQGQQVGAYFIIENTSQKPVDIIDFLKSSDNISYEISSNIIEPQQSILVKMFVNTKSFKGFNAVSLELSIKGYTEKQKVSITFQVN